MADRDLFTGLTTTGTLRNDATLRAGTMFRLSSAETINGLGRWVVAGNSATHQIWLATYVSDGVGNGHCVMIDSVTVDTAGAPANAFLYGLFGSPQVLAAGYYVVLSNELLAGDQWLDADTEPTLDPDCGPGLEFDLFNFGPAYSLDLTGDIPAGQCLTGVGLSGYEYVPVGLLWEGSGVDQTSTDVGGLASSNLFGDITTTLGGAPQASTGIGGLDSTTLFGTILITSTDPEENRGESISAFLTYAVPTLGAGGMLIGTEECPCDDWPFMNRSAEGPDARVYISVKPWPYQDPPLGFPFSRLGCIGLATSTISQEDADAQALAQMAFCMGGGAGGGRQWDSSGDDSTFDGIPGGPVGGRYYSTAQEQDVCPLGGVLTADYLPSGYYLTVSELGLGIVAGEYSSNVSQVMANAAALQDLRATIAGLLVTESLRCGVRWEFVGVFRAGCDVQVSVLDPLIRADFGPVLTPLVYLGPNSCLLWGGGEQATLTRINDATEDTITFTSTNRSPNADWWQYLSWNGNRWYLCLWLPQTIDFSRKMRLMFDFSVDFKCVVNLVNSVPYLSGQSGVAISFADDERVVNPTLSAGQLRADNRATLETTTDPDSMVQTYHFDEVLDTGGAPKLVVLTMLFQSSAVYANESDFPNPIPQYDVSPQVIVSNPTLTYLD